LLNYASIAEFPAVGSDSALFLDESSSRIFQWESPYYIEVGVSGGSGGGVTATDSIHPFLLMGG
jgi:hypothetical protein